MVKSVQAKPLLEQVPRFLARPALATSSVSVAYVTCPETTATLCGYVPVPLDRKYTNGTQLQIYFEVYPHTGGGVAESAIMVNLGGPGPGTTQSRDYFQFLFAPNMDVHDLLLVDDRGTGMSGAIDCPELQHGTAPFVKSEEDCVVQLGEAASRYANGDIAQDMEAVRVALRYNLIDYLGASWGDDIKPEHEELARQAKEITKQFYKDALQSYRYALREELDGRLAAEFLKAKGVIEDPRVRVQLSKAVEEDKRTPEQRAIDAKKRAMEALVSIAVDRSEAFGSPIDTSSEKSVREHVIELHPVGEGKERLIA